MTTTSRCPTSVKHASPPRADATRLPWKRSDGSGVRTLESTCTLCNPTQIYELVAIGGIRRVRRTDTRTLQVHVTANATSREGSEWWQQLLDGLAA